MKYDVKGIFPSQSLSDVEKADPKYGLQVGKAIESEWFKKDAGNTRYFSNRDNFHRLKLYARGEQTIQKYKDELSINGDLSYLNLDWKPVPIIPKFVDIVVNGMSDRLFTVQTYAQDAMSSEKRGEFQEMVETNVIAKPLFKQIEKDFDVDVFQVNPDDLPESDLEMELYMQLNYKPAVEIANECAINTLLAENHYEQTRKRCDLDLMTLGIGVCKHSFQLGDGVKVDYVDPANVVYSYTEDPHFKDCFYWGEIKVVPITELLKIDQSLTNEDLEKISKYSHF